MVKEPGGILKKKAKSANSIPPHSPLPPSPNSGSLNSRDASTRSLHSQSMRVGLSGGSAEWPQGWQAVSTLLGRALFHLCRHTCKGRGPRKKILFIQAFTVCGWLHELEARSRCLAISIASSYKNRLWNARVLKSTSP
jgi:hypothetical protein